MRPPVPAHITRRYLRGACHALALAALPKSKAEVWGLRDGPEGDIHHVFLYAPATQKAFDVRGTLRLEDVGQGAAAAGLVAVPLTVEEVEATFGRPDATEMREARRALRDHLAPAVRDLSQPWLEPRSENDLGLSSL